MMKSILLVGDQFSNLHGIKNSYDDFKVSMINNHDDISNNKIFKIINELEKYLQFPRQTYYDLEKLLDELIKICSCMTDYYNSNTQKVYDYLYKNGITFFELVQRFNIIRNTIYDCNTVDLVKEFQCLKKKISSFLNDSVSLNSVGMTLKCLKNINFNYVIDCDYCDLYFYIYQNSSKIYHLNFDNNKTEIVLGIKEDLHIDDRYYQFYKQYQRLYLNLINDYNQLLFDINHDDEQYVVYIVAYSFNMFDCDLLNPLFLMRNVKLKIYYEKQNFKIIYESIKKWFNNENISLLTIGPNPKIEFCEIY